jgi:hypothetical protein
MNAMLEARMVAVRTQTLELSAQGISAAAERLIVSQGTLIGSMDVVPAV